MGNLRCLITAGPTREYFDAARFLSNPSTGKMGYAIAAAAVKLGWQVRLISGPVQLKIPEGVACTQVISAEQMHQACQKYFPQSDICIMAAAPCDVRPKHFQGLKVRKNDIELSPELLRTSDILAELGRLKKPQQYLVGFAAECDAPANANASVDLPAESSATINKSLVSASTNATDTKTSAAPNKNSAENSATINTTINKSPAENSAPAESSATINKSPAENSAPINKNSAETSATPANANATPASAPANAALAETSNEAPAGKTYLSESALRSAQKKCVAKNLDLIAANCIEAPALGSEPVCQQPSSHPKPSNSASPAGDNNNNDNNDGFTKQANSAEPSDFTKRPNSASPSNSASPAEDDGNNNNNDGFTKRPNSASPSDSSGAAVLPSSGFAAETNTLVLLGGQNEAPVQLGPAPKSILAEHLLEYIGKKLPNAS